MRVRNTLTTVVFLQVFAMFLVVPLIAMHGSDLKLASPELIGVSLGIFGLSNILLLVPFAKLACRYDYKISLIIGLVIFLMGCLLAANAQSLPEFIFARFVQGAGAVIGILQMLLSRITTAPKHALTTYCKIKSFAIIAATLISTVLFKSIGGVHVFLVMALLTLLNIILIIITPTPPHLKLKLEGTMHAIIHDERLLTAFLCALIIYSIFAGAFVAIPLHLIHVAGAPLALQPMVYGLALTTTVVLLWLFNKIIKHYAIYNFFMLLSVLLAGCSTLLFTYQKPSLTIAIIFITMLVFALMLQEIAADYYMKEHSTEHNEMYNRIILTWYRMLGILIGGVSGGLIYARYAILVS